MELEIIQNHKNQAISRILEAISVNELEEIRISFLGRKGSLTQLIKSIPTLKIEDRAEAGRQLNEAKETIEKAILRAANNLSAEKDSPKNWIDPTAPGIKPDIGHLHLITQTITEISRIFGQIGFNRTSYPEVEWDWYAFGGLNMPSLHPARDAWETFFIKKLKSDRFGRGVLTPHTSSGQLREMENLGQPPIRMLNIAKCYRRQSDISHAVMFYQFEGLAIDANINITHLKGTLNYFVKQYFGQDRQTRIRPYHFRFTEPSFEVDVTCILCHGKGCSACKEGWMELGGAGMVHPIVLKNGGIDPLRYSGFAWGWGVERLLMMKYGIPDIRLLFNGDLKFINQF